MSLENERGARPVRVLLAAAAFPPYHTGAGRRFLSYAEGLRARGVELSVASLTPTSLRARAAGTAPDWLDAPLGTWLPEEQVGGVRVQRLRVGERRDRRRTLHFVAALSARVRREPPDVLLLLEHSVEYLPLLAVARGAGIATAVAYTLMLTRGRSRVRRAVERLLWPLVFERADGVVMGSRALEASLRGFGVRRPVDVIPPGVPAEVFHPCPDAAARSALRESLGLPPHRRLLLSVGAISTRKGADLLLEAFAAAAPRHPDADLVLAGPLLESASGPFREALTARLRSLGARVHCLGQTDRIPELLRAADLLLLASQREGVPNAALEAMASGCPVVATRFAGLEGEDGPPEEALLLVPRSAEALAAGLDEALSDPRSLAERSVRARDWVVCTHARARTLDAYAAFFHRLAAAGPG